MKELDDTMQLGNLAIRPAHRGRASRDAVLASIQRLGGGTSLLSSASPALPDAAGARYGDCAQTPATLDRRTAP